MTPPRVATESLRHAALVLHGMSDEDRDWVLAALPAAERERLLPLLLELQEIGVTRDASVLGQLTVRSGRQSRKAAPGPLESLDRQSVASLARVLNAEPPQLVACFLGLRDWPWHARLVRLLDPSRRQPSRRPQLAPALQEALLAAVGRKLESERALPTNGRRVFGGAAQRLRSIWSAR